ncbi:MAG TPA: hypothetical protein VM238_18625 [Phycisphaerae bacterium]|nr:hypothetical protein [Phycisphaerae bacterium]
MNSTIMIWLICPACNGKDDGCTACDGTGGTTKEITLAELKDAIVKFDD